MKKSLRELLSEEVVDLRVRVDLGDVEVPDLAADDVTIELSEELPAESEEGDEEGGEEEVAIEVEEDEEVEEVEVEADAIFCHHRCLTLTQPELREHVVDLLNGAALHRFVEKLATLAAIKLCHSLFGGSDAWRTHTDLIEPQPNQ